jgi:hypothetical protein
MTTLRILAAAAAAVLAQAGAAQAHCGHTGSVEGPCVVSHAPVASSGGRYAQVPGCCANAPVPTAQRGNIRYIYPDGRQVLVRAAGRGLGKEPFWWWAVPPH